jgi:glycosyltransferase involved in cell wall biosynthesis
MLRVLLHYLRLSDYAAAQRVDHFVANSNYTKTRIYKYYRRLSEVIYPPIDTSFYCPQTHGDIKDNEKYFLVVGRLSPAKNFDQAVRVCEKLGLNLVVVGQGLERLKLEKMSGKHTVFVGSVSNKKLREYYRGAEALLQPTEEDFGMAAAEALACGTPVIGYGCGGIKEVVDDGVTGLLYNDPHEEMLAEAIRKFIERKNGFRPEALQGSVLKYSKNRFREGLMQCVERALVSKK